MPPAPSPSARRASTASGCSSSSARRWDGDAVPVSLAEVAADEDLPRAYLEQLVIPLRDAGIVLSTRGARGGYALARPPAEITMSEALRALEGPLAPMICASEDPAHATPACAWAPAPSTASGSRSATPSAACSTRSPSPTSSRPARASSRSTPSSRDAVPV